MTVIQIVVLYILLVNLGGFVAFGVDKKKSQRAKWRIPETTLMTFALLGGSPGCLLAMNLFRHKTQKPLFYIGIPAILIVEVLFVLIIGFLTPISFMIQ